MKNEFKIFFSKKFILIALPLILIVSIFLWYASASVDEYSYDSMYSDFVKDIKVYETQEELVEQYKKFTNNNIPGMIYNNNSAKYTELIYKFSIQNQLPYDSLVIFSEETKYTQFYYLESFNYSIIIFIILSSLLIGGFYQTSDVMSKMSKLVYSSGERRSKIIDRKYGVSLLILAIAVIVFESIVALLGLMYCDSGAKYCIFYTGSDSLYYLNYFDYFCLFLANHLIALIVTYTSIYYISVIFKNGIIPVCAIFSMLLVYAFVQTKIPADLFFDMMVRNGIIKVFYNRDITNAINLKDLCIYIPIALLPVIVFVISRFFIKRADYSR
ncbi:MAG: hypothetical protein OSJ74_01025 [Clostridia bacterium]|nr:hypothetical protein [Clostridia bacterium]